jgi:hypothetical protein
MSIWSTVRHDIRAQDGDFGDANYRAEGEERFGIGVARTEWHDYLRLSVIDERPTPFRGPVDLALLLSPDAARELRDALTEALGES